ncbi:molybdate ABC transporter substrate-binding protein [bacterium]|nr:molybdate ABC transporter substrate-binding protein [bacterium]
MKKLNNAFLMFLILILSLPSLSTCKGVKGDKLFVYCGAAISPPMLEIGKEFEKQYGTKVEFTFAGSPCLLAQITFAKSGDLYMPGEDWYMDQAIKKGLIEKWAPVALFTPVIAVQKGNPKKIKSILDFRREDLRIGLGNKEACAIGKISDEIFKKAEKVLGAKGLAEAIWKNTKYMAMQEPELGNTIKLKHIDATIIWNSTAYRIRNSIDIIPIDPRYRIDSTIPLGVLKFSNNKELAYAFLEFVQSSKSQSIFKKHGFSIPNSLKNKKK